MRSEEEAREMLEELEERHAQLMRESEPTPCAADGSSNPKHIMAVNVSGELAMLRWVLEDEG